MQTLTDESQLDGPAVVVEFGAKWCSPCKQLEPILRDLAMQLPQLTFLKVDGDDRPDLTTRYGVMTGYPVVVMLRRGQEVGRFLGTKPRAAVMRQLALAFDL